MAAEVPVADLRTEFWTSIGENQQTKVSDILKTERLQDDVNEVCT